MQRLSLSCLAALAALAVAACGGTTASSGPSAAAGSVPASATLACEKTEAPAEGSVAASIKDFKFSPQPIKAKVDQVIVWGNDDSAPHTASLSDGSCGTDQIPGGAHAALVFNVVGTYTYQCNVHPGQMKDYTIEITQ
jgi:plastocyanin